MRLRTAKRCEYPSGRSGFQYPIRVDEIENFQVLLGSVEATAFQYPIRVDEIENRYAV